MRELSWELGRTWRRPPPPGGTEDHETEINHSFPSRRQLRPIAWCRYGGPDGAEAKREQSKPGEAFLRTWAVARRGVWALASEPATRVGDRADIARCGEANERRLEGRYRSATSR